ncbi:MAG: ATP-binding cassette domain-containing protein, partial [Scardovia wiggsiae]|nr:ATP-binding cassette domain-containing protein [Scardovia wiggsiae]
MSGYQTPDPVPGQGEPPAPAASAARAAAASGQVPIIELRDVDVVFTTRAGKLFHPNKIKAVNKVNIQLLAGQTIGIVGESGCGKSTTANVMCGLQQATSGQVLFKGVDVTHRSAKDRKEIGRVVSVVFQDPATALNARMTVEDQLIDPLVVHKLGDRKSRAARAR